MDIVAIRPIDDSQHPYGLFINGELAARGESPQDLERFLAKEIKKQQRKDARFLGAILGVVLGIWSS